MSPLESLVIHHVKEAISLAFRPASTESKAIGLLRAAYLVEAKYLSRIST